MAIKKRYYWLKLYRDFFKRHDIKIIESMDNGKDYILFYLKLLTESVDHDGELRFSDEIPYDEKMLSAITNTNVDTVRSAVQIFTKVGMMEQWDDGTYFMSRIDKMIGSETSNAERVRRFRERKALQCNIDVTNCNKNANTELRVKSLESDYREENKEKKQEKKESSVSQHPEPFQPYIPPDRDYTQEFETIKSHWNSETGKAERKTLFQFSNSGKIMDRMEPYELEEIKTAISNYSQHPDSKKLNYSLPGFLESGVPNYLNNQESKPSKIEEVDF